MCGVLWVVPGVFGTYGVLVSTGDATDGGEETSDESLLSLLSPLPITLTLLLSELLPCEVFQLNIDIIVPLFLFNVFSPSCFSSS